MKAILMAPGVKDKWSLGLPFATRIVNSAVDSSIGVSPNRLVFGRATNEMEPLRVIRSSRKDETCEYVSQLEEMLDRVVTASARHLASEAAAREGRRRRRPKKGGELHEGEYVVVEYPARAPSKLHATYRGPMLVVNASRPDILTCLDLVTQKQLVIHADRLRRFVVPVGTTVEELQQVAASDHDEYTVEAVLGHRFKSKGKKSVANLEIHVAWAGYELTEATWEPYQQVKDVQLVDEYVVKNKLPRAGE